MTTHLDEIVRCGTLGFDLLWEAWRIRKEDKFGGFVSASTEANCFCDSLRPGLGRGVVVGSRAHRAERWSWWNTVTLGTHNGDLHMHSVLSRHISNQSLDTHAVRCSEVVQDTYLTAATCLNIPKSIARQIRV